VNQFTEHATGCVIGRVIDGHVNGGRVGSNWVDVGTHRPDQGNPRRPGLRGTANGSCAGDFADFVEEQP
jgi:hypothetical protein